MPFLILSGNEMYRSILLHATPWMSVLACSPTPVAWVEDTGSEITDFDSQDSADVEDQDPSYFEPLVYLLADMQFAWVDQQITSFTTSEETIEPYLEFHFVGSDWYLGDEDAVCRWTGTPSFEASSTSGNWLSLEGSIERVQTNCESFDPIVWGENTPSLALESMIIYLEFSALTDDMKAQLEALYEESGEGWSSTSSHLLYTVFMAIDSEHRGMSVEPVAYGVVRELETDGSLTQQLNGDAIPLVLNEETIPEGALRAWGLEGLPVQTLWVNSRD